MTRHFQVPTGFQHIYKDFCVGFEDVMLWLQDLKGDRIGELANWQADRRNIYKNDFDIWLGRYKNFQHKAIFSIQPQEVVDVVKLAKKTPVEHALGRSRFEEKYKSIHNLTSCPPLVFAFHVLLERLGRIPLWSEYLAFHEQNTEYFLDDFFRLVGFDMKSPRYDINGDGEMGALRYRLGNQYYAAIKDLYVLSHLRHKYHIDARCHFLIDVVWKVDIYSGPVLLEVYVPNTQYKTGDEGRKLKAHMVHKQEKVLQFITDIRKDFGSCWLPTDEIIDKVAHSAIRDGAHLL